MSLLDLKKQNTIAYDKLLRDELAELHEALGGEITDVAMQAVDYGVRFNPKAKQILKKLSLIASDLSVLLINAKGDKVELSAEEKFDYDNVKNLTEYLGNLQYKLGKIIQKSDEFKRVASELSELGVGCAEQIMKTQEKFLSVRANINDLAYLSVNPSKAYEYREELAKSTN